MKRIMLKTLLALLPTLLFGTLQAQNYFPVNFLAEADSLQASKTCIRPILFEGKVYTILYTQHTALEGEFVLYDPEINKLRKASVPCQIEVADMKVVDNFVYFCGQDSSHKGVVGYFKVIQFFESEIQYHWVEFPAMQYRDNVTGTSGGPYYNTYNIFKLEVLDSPGTFNHLAVLCDMGCANDTATALGEIYIQNNTVNCAAIFTSNAMEQFYDMTLTDDYLLTVSTKGPGSDHFPYMIRYFSRQTPPPFLPLSASHPIPSLSTHHIATENSGPSLIEATSGDDIIVAYHSNNDTTQRNTQIHLDIYSPTSTTTTYSATLADPSCMFSKNKMYDIVYDAPNNTFWLLHEVNTSHRQQIIKINNTLSTATAYYNHDLCLQSIDYDNAIGMGVASGFDTSNIKLTMFGEQAGAPWKCLKPRTTNMVAAPQKTLGNVTWYFSPSQNTAVIQQAIRPITIESYQYPCNE